MDIKSMQEMKEISGKLHHQFKKMPFGVYRADEVETYLDELVKLYQRLLTRIMQDAEGDRAEALQRAEAQWKQEIENVEKRIEKEWQAKIDERTAEEQRRYAERLQEVNEASHRLAQLAEEMRNAPAVVDNVAAKEVLDAAEKEAADIVARAKRDAEAIVKSAKSEADEMIKVSQLLIDEQSIRARSMLVDVRSRIEKQVKQIDTVVNGELNFANALLERSRALHEQLNDACDSAQTFIQEVASVNMEYTDNSEVQAPGADVQAPQHEQVTFDTSERDSHLDTLLQEAQKITASLEHSEPIHSTSNTPAAQKEPVADDSLDKDTVFEFKF